MKKNDRSSINPFTGKKHFNIVNDDKFLDNSYVEYDNIINHSQLSDETPEGQIVSNVSFKLIKAVENHLSKIKRSDYTENYYDWEFHLVSNETVNAFCMPGGKIIVYSGILTIAEKEEYLAFILGHEMAHALLDHGRTTISAYTAKNTASTVARLGSFGLGLLGFGEAASVVTTVTNVADIGSEYLLLKPWGRDQEMEADKLGMMIVNWAGYDISEIPYFWQKMSEHNSNKHDFFSTHPSDNKRIAGMNELVMEISTQENFNSTLISSGESNQKIITKENHESKFCKQCGAENVVESKFCKQCGKEMVVESKFCTRCGKEIVDDAKFCTQCGNSLAKYR
ncbi:MAG: M48 family metallopeptidase [Methanobrevibacter sp.]|nr:M48 family metallopeptidase [Methanobrevibacter sp.]